MKAPPNILDALIVGPLTVEIDWSTGETLSVDLSDFTAPPSDALRNPEFFADAVRCLAGSIWELTSLSTGPGVGWIADGERVRCLDAAQRPVAGNSSYITRHGPTHDVFCTSLITILRRIAKQ
jgi:hypothetical protein